LYAAKKTSYGNKAYTQISKLFEEAKPQHKIDFEKTVDYQKTLQKGKIPDHEQSWRAFKGKNLEKLIEYVITDEIQTLGYEIVNGSTLERANVSLLSLVLSKVKRNIAVDYGQFGMHLPDADMIVYKPNTGEVVGLLSVKTTLRERIAQTGYWKLKLNAQIITKHIKMIFITLDEDKTLTQKSPAKKGRAITEIDTDACFVLSETIIEESDKVKMFDKFAAVLKTIF
jgi:type II restriction enzyme